MARDKLITIRIEGEKRQAFGDLAKSQNTDTASLLYDFINQCLSGTIDISLVTGKKQWIDKLDNQLDSERIDKLETATQEIDNRLGKLSKKLNDWIEAIDDRLTDSDQGLSKKITSLEHRLNALAIQLDSQEIDGIDTDSQKDSQQENPDMKPLLKRERKASIAAPIPTEEPSHDEPDRPAIETLTPEVSPSPPSPVKEAIETVTGDSDSIDTEPGEVVTKTDSKPWYTIDDLLDCHYPGWPKTKEGLRKKALTEGWPRRTQRGSKGNPYEYQAVLPE